MTVAVLHSRRAERQAIEMMARFRHTISTVTVMLKDITPLGARIEGVGPLARDDATFLMLPGLAPKLAFVAWATDHSAGLEFASALPHETFEALVADFGRKSGESLAAA